MGYLDMSSAFVYRDPAFRAKFDALAENDAYLKDNGWVNNTKTIFYQAAVPTGWTKDTSHDDKFLRVVSGIGAGSGGSQAASSTVSIAHATHTFSSGPDHTHVIDDHYHVLVASGALLGVPPITTNHRLAKSDDFGGSAGFLIGAVAGGSSVAFDDARNKLVVLGTSSTGSAGSHDHGGVVDSTELADFVFKYIDVLIGTKDSSAGYVDLTNEFDSGDKLDFDPFDQLADNDAYLKDRLLPTGTVSIFAQATAPTSWSKLTSLDNAGLRVVSGTGGGTGGTQGFGSTVSLAHTHDIAAASGHTHSIPNHTHTILFTNEGSVSDFSLGIHLESGVFKPNGTFLTSPHDIPKYTTPSGGSGTSGTSPSHTHELGSSLADFTLAYLDVIQCEKLSTGAPFAYDDMTAVFAWKKLVSKQRLNRLGKNDAHILYHTTNAGTKMFFYMPTAPLTWTKITTSDDRGLRVVSGATGGSQGGGAQGLSQAITLAHTHTIVADAHTHAMNSHTHSLDTASASVTPGDTATGFPGTEGQIIRRAQGPGAEASLTSTSGNPLGTTGSNSHDHGGVTSSTLTNITLAYADVLLCEKT